MKKILVSVLVILSVFAITGCSNTKNSEDALKFKKEYESLNGKTNAMGAEHRTVTIDENNPYVYATQKEIVEKINNKETFYLYVGDKQCPWCRSVIEKSIEVAKAKKIKTIYYINIWDDEHNEIFRDKYELDQNGNASLVSKGTDEYYELLKAFDKVLNDYTLTDEGGNEVKVGEKRIYAPNYFYVKEGKVQKMVEGSSDKQKDSREELTKEMLKDEEKAFKELFK